MRRAAGLRDIPRSAVLIWPYLQSSRHHRLAGDSAMKGSGVDFVTERVIHSRQPYSSQRGAAATEETTDNPARPSRKFLARIKNLRATQRI